MRTLFIFDAFMRSEKVLPRLFEGTGKLFLFPITSKDSIAEGITCKAGRFCNDVEVINVADLINRTAEFIKPLYLRFIAQLPHRIRHEGRDLKEIFALDDHASVWWFSLIAEKNPYKSDSFNTLVQLESVIRIIKEKKADRLIFGCRNSKLYHALREYAKSNAIDLRIISAKTPGGMREKILGCQKWPLLQSFGRLLYFMIKYFIRTAFIYARLRRYKREVKTGDPLLAILYYPAFDMDMAEKGIFKNKQYAGLQDSLESEGRGITWLALYTPKDSLTLQESLGYAERFIRAGQSLFFLEEFNSPAVQFKSILSIFRTAVNFLNIEKTIVAAHTFGEYNFYSIFKNDWYASFAGHVGYAGISQYHIFRRVLEIFQAKKCLYFCEMQAWEKALVSARNSLNCRTSIFGYQSGTVSEMLLMYFNDPEEVADRGRYALPRPDKILCNGRVPYQYLKRSGWRDEDIMIVEAVRYNYLRKHVNNLSPHDQRSVMVILSIHPEESSSILTMAYKALKDIEGIKLLVRPHPFLPFKKVLALSGMNREDPLLDLVTGPVEDVLSKSKIVICGESSMCIEALTFGSIVVVVDVPEWINMSPFKDFKSKQIVRVGSPDELRRVVIDNLHITEDAKNESSEVKRVLDEFFYFNGSSDAPTRILEVLKA